MTSGLPVRPFVESRPDRRPGWVLGSVVRRRPAGATAAERPLGHEELIRAHRHLEPAAVEVRAGSTRPQDPGGRARASRRDVRRHQLVGSSATTRVVLANRITRHDGCGHQASRAATSSRRPLLATARRHHHHAGQAPTIVTAFGDSPEVPEKADRTRTPGQRLGDPARPGDPPRPRSGPARRAAWTASPTSSPRRPIRPTESTFPSRGLRPTTRPMASPVRSVPWRRPGTGIWRRNWSCAWSTPVVSPPTGFRRRRPTGTRPRTRAGATRGPESSASDAARARGPLEVQ